MSDAASFLNDVSREYDSGSRRVDDDRREGSRRSYGDERSSSGRRDHPRYDDRDRGSSGGSRYRDDYRNGSSRDYRSSGGGGGRRYDDGRRDNYQHQQRRGGGPPPPPNQSSGGHGNRGARVFEGFAEQGPREATPEDTIPISKRKRKFTAWDVKPPGFENYTAEQAKMTGMFNLPGQQRQAPMGAGQVNNMAPMFVPFHQQQQQQQSSQQQANSAARQARRLYVGNVTTDATEENLTAFFNTKMVEMNLANDRGLADDLAQTPGVSGDKPVISVHVNYEKQYAFIEFRNPDEATSALAMDGIIFQNNALKLRRPKDFEGDEADGQMRIPGVVGTMVHDSPHKIFIGGIPSYLTDDQVMELLQSFGELKSFNLVKEPGTGVSKGFAFCEYVDGEGVTDVACQGLNGMELGDRVLVVQRASLGQHPPDPNAAPGSGGGGMPVVPIPNSKIIAATAGEGNPTRILQILNMVSPDELADAAEYADIVDDVRDECGKYGTVTRVYIPKPAVTAQGRYDAKASESIPDLGKVFVEYADVDATKAALKAIAGRTFGGRMLVCTYYQSELPSAPSA